MSLLTDHYMNPSHEWIYAPYLRRLAAKACLKPGMSLLDIGCGPGFFTGQFARMGLHATGVDLIPKAIDLAVHQGVTGTSFVVYDAMELPWAGAFDSVFVRSFALYSRRDFARNRFVTEKLLSYLKPGGYLIFCYNTRLRHPNPTGRWLYHTLEHAQSHFSIYPGAEVFFTLRGETQFFGLSETTTRICARISELTNLGGELVAFVRKAL